MGVGWGDGGNILFHMHRVVRDHVREATVTTCNDRYQTFTTVYFCTKEAGHEGDHTCYNNWGKPIAIWEQEEESEDVGNDD